MSTIVLAGSQEAAKRWKPSDMANVVESRVIAPAGGDMPSFRPLRARGAMRVLGKAASVRAQRARSVLANPPKGWMAALWLLTLFFGVLPVMSLLWTLTSGENRPRWLAITRFMPSALLGFSIIGGVFRRARRAADRNVGRSLRKG